ITSTCAPGSRGACGNGDGFVGGGAGGPELQGFCELVALAPDASPPMSATAIAIGHAAAITIAPPRAQSKERSLSLEHLQEIGLADDLELRSLRDELVRRLVL